MNEVLTPRNLLKEAISMQKLKIIALKAIQYTVKLGYERVQPQSLSFFNVSSILEILFDFF